MFQIDQNDLARRVRSLDASDGRTAALLRHLATLCKRNDLIQEIDLRVADYVPA